MLASDGNLCLSNGPFNDYYRNRNRNRNLETSKALLKSQAHQGTSLFTSAATNQRGVFKGGSREAQVRIPEYQEGNVPLVTSIDRMSCCEIFSMRQSLFVKPNTSRSSAYSSRWLWKHWAPSTTQALTLFPT